jgi:Ni,Fe-hydrogenase maturation factor
MPPRLVLGLGSALTAEDAAGSLVAHRLKLDPRLPVDVEVRSSGDLPPPCAVTDRTRRSISPS